MGINQVPQAVVTKGVSYGTPTVFNNSGTYTIPANATVNSTILFELVNGGTGGSIGQSALFNNNTVEGPSSPGGGVGGNWSLGSTRFAYFSNTPAGETITVTVGAGGSGGSKTGPFTLNGNFNSYQSIPGANSAGTGGLSALTYKGTTINSSNNSVPIQLSSISGLVYSGAGASGGSGNSSNAYNTPNNGGNSKTDWLDAANNTGGGISTIGAQSNTIANANSATVAGCGGGGAGPRRFTTSPINSGYGNGGDGLQPGGGGGGGGGFATSVSPITFNGNTAGGAGGAGRVRIWFAE